MLTTAEIYSLRQTGQTEEAYEACRKLYAADKSGTVAKCMFWTALDMMRLLTRKNNGAEASRVGQALERLLRNLGEADEKYRQALSSANQQLANLTTQNSNQTIAAHAALGRWGEDQAERYLREQGYDIVERDWHSSHRDIDIIAREGDVLVFVEVKTRSTNSAVAPEEAVDYHKQRNLQRAINHYINQHYVDNEWRLDVIAITGEVGKLSSINHIKDFTLSVR